MSSNATAGGFVVAGELPPDVAEVASALLEASHGSTATDVLPYVGGQFVDVAAAEVKSDLPAECRRGCFWCCYPPVSVGVAEAVAVAEYVLREKSAKVRKDILARVNEYADWQLARTPKERLLGRKACPFLFNGLCSVYEVRPMACRGYVSPTPDACERMAKDSEAMTLTDHTLSSFASNVSLALSGIYGALGAGNGNLRIYHFALVARAVLEDPSVVLRWLTGEDVFAFADSSEAGDVIRGNREADEARFAKEKPLLLEEVERRAGREAADRARATWETWEKRAHG